MRRAALFVLVACAIASAPACLLTNDFDGIVGTRPLDAGGGGDGDGEAVSDAGGDGSAAFVSCAASQHLVCSDFDEGAVTNGGWKSDATNGGKTTLDSAQSVTAPASFRSTIPELAGTTGASADLEQTIHVGAWSTATYAFDMRIGTCTLPDVANAGSTTIAVFEPAMNDEFGLVLSHRGWELAELFNGVFKPFSLVRGLPDGAWMRVSIEVALSGSAGHATMTVDGEVFADTDLDPQAPGPNIILNIGANATGPAGSCDIDFDDVTFDIE